MPCSGCKTCDVSTGKCSGGGGSGSGSGSSTGGGGGGGGTVNTIIVVGAAGVGSVLIAGLLIYAKKNLNLGRGKSADNQARSRREPLLATEVPASTVYDNLERDTTVMMMSEDFPELPPLDSF